MKTEMDKLESWLIKNHIQYTRKPLLGGEQILITTTRKKFSCICHMYSYGHKTGLIEMRDFQNDVEGYLNAEKCKRIIKKVCRVS